MNIRELDEESRRTGVWPPRRIILRVERGSSHVEEPQHEVPVSVGLVDLASPSRPTVRTSERSRHAAPKVAPERLAAGQVAPRPPLSRPPAPGSVVRRNGRIVAAPRPASRLRDEDAEFEKWLAMPLAISDSDPDYQEPPVWLPEDRRLRAERRHRRITRRTRAQLFGTSAATIDRRRRLLPRARRGAVADRDGGRFDRRAVDRVVRHAPGAFRRSPAERAATVSKPAAKTAARKPAKSARTAPAHASSSSHVQPGGERLERPGARHHRLLGAHAARGDPAAAAAARRHHTARADDAAQGVDADEDLLAQARPGAAGQQLTVELGQPVAGRRRRAEPLICGRRAVARHPPSAALRRGHALACASVSPGGSESA